MQPHSRQNPNPNPNSNHQHDQYHRHCHHHCTHHPPFPHVHIPVLFCPHHHHHHHHLHLHHLHFHATQLPCNFSLPSSSPLPHSQTFSNQTSQGPEINHATVSDLESPPQELAASNILEDNEEEEEDVYVLTDEWAELFAKSDAKRQLDIKRNRLKQNLKRQGSLAGGVHGGPVPISSLLNSVPYKATELFIGGLSRDTDDQSLKEAFSNFGNVTEDTKQTGLEQNLKKQGSLAGGVSGGSVPTSSLLNSVPYMDTKLFVGGLSRDTDDQSLKEAFSNFGNVTEARVIRDRDIWRSKKFGFISFDTSEAARSALSSKDVQKLHGKKIPVSYANERPAIGFRADCGLGGSAAGYGGSSAGYDSSADTKQTGLKQNLKRQGSLAGGVNEGSVPTSSLLNLAQYFGTKLFVGGLSPDTDVQSLKEAFSNFGNVTEVRVFTPNSERSDGFGFVSFDTAEAAKSALSSMAGQKLHGRKIKVRYGKDQRPTRGFRADRGYDGSAGGYDSSSGGYIDSSGGDGGSSGGYGGSAGQNY